jgi:hypothetical protein
MTESPPKVTRRGSARVGWRPPGGSDVVVVGTVVLVVVAEYEPWLSSAQADARTTSESTASAIARPVRPDIGGSVVSGMTHSAAGAAGVIP